MARGRPKKGFEKSKLDLNLADENIEEEEEDIDGITLEAKIVAKRIKELFEIKDGKRFKVFDKDTKIEINYGEFVEELKKGYGKSKYVQIARLFELSDGIYYDNEYVD